MRKFYRIFSIVITGVFLCGELMASDSAFSRIEVANGRYTIAMSKSKRLEFCAGTELQVMQLKSTHSKENEEGFSLQKEYEGSKGEKAAIAESLIKQDDNVIVWKVKIYSENDRPWSVPIDTVIKLKSPSAVKLWTTWSDPDYGLQNDGNWRDPLVFKPFESFTLHYGGPVNGESDHGYCGRVDEMNKSFSVPIVTIADQQNNTAVSLILSPDDDVIAMNLSCDPNGRISFSRLNHRLQKKIVWNFTAYIVCHQADWRGGLGWMTEKFPDSFYPPNIIADKFSGTASYSNYEGELDVSKLKDMGYSFNWKASYDFPYMGVFLPPIDNPTETWERMSNLPRYSGQHWYSSNRASLEIMENNCDYMRFNDLWVLNYFNITEFGISIKWPLDANQPNCKQEELWKDANCMLYSNFKDAILLKKDGSPFFSWEGCVAMDPGEKNYQDWLVDQARRHIKYLPSSGGICIDRQDWTVQYNCHADDGMAFIDGVPARSLVNSWKQTISRISELMHKNGKVVFCNNQNKRLDLMFNIDGIYDEHGHIGSMANSDAFISVKKPAAVWTPNSEFIKNTGVDNFFQRHLYLGLYPTCPFPKQSHSISDDPWAEEQYLSYGHLLNAMKGKKWVLQDNVLSVEGAKGNIFEVPDGYLIPIVFADTNGVKVTVSLEDLLLKSPLVQVIYPGNDTVDKIWQDADYILDGSKLKMKVSCRNRCALIRCGK